MARIPNFCGPKDLKDLLVSRPSWSRKESEAQRGQPFRARTETQSCCPVQCLAHTSFQSMEVTGFTQAPRSVMETHLQEPPLSSQDKYQVQLQSLCFLSSGIARSTCWHYLFKHSQQSSKIRANIIIMYEKINLKALIRSSLVIPCPCFSLTVKASQWSSKASPL